MTDKRQQPDEATREREDRAVDYVLGALTPEQRREARDALDRDPEFVLEVSELRNLFEDLRDLTVEPSEDLTVRLRYALVRRQRVRREVEVRHVGDGLAFRAVLQVAAVALIVLGGLLFSKPLWEERVRKAVQQSVAMDLRPALPVPQVPPPSRSVVVRAPELEQVHPRDPLPRLDVTIDDPILVKNDANFRRQLASLPQLSREELQSLQPWLVASNELDRLRREFQHRISRRDRREALRRCGHGEEVDDRIQDLAIVVAHRSDELLGAGVEMPVQDVALALRALLAAGSRTRIGPHQHTIRRLGDNLLARVEELDGPELASALSGLMDLAIVTGRRMERLVGRHVRRLADSVFVEGSPMLNWETDPAHLADAGQVLRLAPAFGVPAYLAGRARILLAAHLGVRIDGSKVERPELIAAQLYGFGDLVDRRELDRRLLLWRVRTLASSDLVALHHVSWSQFPVREGWSRFQQDLQGLAVLPTPRKVRDGAALLLCLAMNYAAPGSISQVITAVDLR